jgi:hypothetical protein
MPININGTTIQGGGNFTVANSSNQTFFSNYNTQTLQEPSQIIEGTVLPNSAWRMSKVERRAGTIYYTAAREMDNGSSPGYTRDIFTITPSHGWVSYHCKFRIYGIGYAGPANAEWLVDGTGGDYTGVIKTIRGNSGGIQLQNPSLRVNQPQAGPNNFYDGDSRVNQVIQMQMPSWTSSTVEVEWSSNFSLVSSITANWQILLQGS